MEKVVWITGASGGIGEALAVAFARKNARLILSARRKEELDRVAKICRHNGASSVKVMVLDMTKPSAIDASAKAVQQEFERVDILINNAGISQRSFVKDTELSVIRRVMEVDFFGAIALSKALLPGMIKAGGGQFVVVSSLVGKFATPYRSGYAAAKHALHGFFDALRAEHYQDRIAVTLLCPGFIKTQITYNALTGSGGRLNQMDQAQANGMLPEKFARKALMAIERKKAEAYIGGKERFGIYIHRFWPGLFRKLIRKASVR